MADTTVDLDDDVYPVVEAVSVSLTRGGLLTTPLRQAVCLLDIAYVAVLGCALDAVCDLTQGLAQQRAVGLTTPVGQGS